MEDVILIANRIPFRSCSPQSAELTVFVEARELQRNNVQRHECSLLLPSPDHRAHDARRESYDLGLLCRDTELEVLDEVGHDGLHFDHASKHMSVSELQRSHAGNTHENFQLLNIIVSLCYK